VYIDVLNWFVDVGAPIINSVSTDSSTSLRISWSPPEGLPAIVGYRLSYTPSGSCDGHVSGSQLVDGQDTLEAILDGLEPGVTYDVSVQARGQQAFGTMSGTISGTTNNAGMDIELYIVLWLLMIICCLPAPSGPPANVTIQPRSVNPALVVSWDPPACHHINSQQGLTGYVLRYRQQGTEQWTTDTIPAPSITRLTVACGINLLLAYEVQVAARNGQGLGVFSFSSLGAVVTGAGELLWLWSAVGADITILCPPLFINMFSLIEPLYIKHPSHT